MALLRIQSAGFFVQEEKCDYFKKFKWQCVQTSHVPVCAKKYCESGVSFQNSNNCIFYHYFCLPFKLNGPPEQQRSRFRLIHQMALQCICRTHSIRSAQLDASLFFPIAINTMSTFYLILACHRMCEAGQKLPKELVINCHQSATSIISADIRRFG